MNDSMLNLRLKVCLQTDRKVATLWGPVSVCKQALGIYTDQKHTLSR